MTPISTRLKRLAACNEAVEWSKQFTDAQAAWDACERGDWMLWIIGRRIKSAPWSDDRKLLLAAALDCACTVKHLWPKEHRKQISAAVKTLRAWIAGEASVEQAKDARKNLYAVYAAAAYAAAAAAADADAYAAYAAAADADAAAAAADGAYAAAAAAAAARTKSQKRCAKIVRGHFPNAPK